MKLSDYELLLGVVENSDDPLKRGRVQCTITGVLDVTTISPENLLWVMPFSQSGYQAFSKPMEGQLVWILHNTKHKKENWYIPFASADTKMKKYMKDNYDNNAEVIFNRNIPGNTLEMTVDDTNGVNIKAGDDNGLNIKPTGNIDLNGSQSQVKLDGENIKIGKKPGTDEEDKIDNPVVMGKNIDKFLEDLKNKFYECAGKCISYPDVKNCLNELGHCVSKFKGTLSSEHVFVN